MSTGELTYMQAINLIGERLSNVYQSIHFIWYHVFATHCHDGSSTRAFPPPVSPAKSLLRDAGVQQWLYKHCFDTDTNPHLPSDRYRLRVLKPLLRKVEQAIEDPEEDVGHLMSLDSLSLLLLLLPSLCNTLEYLVLILLSLPRRFPMISCLAFPLS